MPGLKESSYETLPIHVERLGKEIGITQYFLGTEMPYGGLHMSRQWWDRGVSLYMKQNFQRPYAERLSDMDLRAIIGNVKGLSPELKETIFDKVKRGEDVVFIHPLAKGKGTAVHETMHGLTERELLGDLQGDVHNLNETVGQLVRDSKASEIRDVGGLAAHNLDWLSKKQEFFTEVMTQYFLGNLKPGTKTVRLAEAILRNSKNPNIQKLVGTSLQVAISYRLMKKQSKRAD